MVMEIITWLSVTITIYNTITFNINNSIQQHVVVFAMSTASKNVHSKKRIVQCYLRFCLLV